MLNREKQTTGKSNDLMTGKVPLEIGTRGTIGSLVQMEIEYFRGLEIKQVESFHHEETASGGRSSWPKFRFLIASLRRKKRSRGGICSVVDIADNEIPGFSYLNIRTDSQRYDVENMYVNLYMI